MEHCVIAVCTARRPVMLRACLAAIAELRVPDGADLAVVVVENDKEPRCRELVSEMSATTGLTMRYSQEPRPGIPLARNKALQEAIAAKADWIGLVDDDERIDRDWLARLLAACREHGADVGSGPVRRVLEAPVPGWWKSQSPKDMETGTPIRQAATNNVLMHARLVRPDGLALRFDERLTYGGEDLDFFRRAHGRGAHMIWVADAWVEEDIPASRLQPRRLLSRLHMAAAASAFTMALQEGRLRAAMRLAPGGLRRVLVGALVMLASLLLSPFRAKQGEAMYYSGATKVAKGAGSIRGLLGVAHRYYDDIDGR